MKTTPTLLASVACLAVHCGPIGFDIAKDIPEQTVQGNAAANLAGQQLPAGTLMPMAISVDIAAESRARNVPIARLLVKSFALNITSTAMPPGDADDFAFIRTATIVIECTGGSCAGQTQQVGTAVGVAGSSTMAFTINPGVNIKPFIENGSRITLQADAIPPPDDTSFSARLVLRAEPF
jgi:hypothetical protein